MYNGIIHGLNKINSNFKLLDDSNKDLKYYCMMVLILFIIFWEDYN